MRHGQSPHAIAAALVSVCLLTPACSTGRAAKTDAEPPDPRFVRFVSTDEAVGHGRLETAIKCYRDAAGRQVDLVGMIHFGEEEYYAAIQDEISPAERVLYECLRGPADSDLDWVPNPLASPCGLVQQFEGIEYDDPRFVHADLTESQFLAIDGADEILQNRLTLERKDLDDLVLPPSPERKLARLVPIDPPSSTTGEAGDPVVGTAVTVHYLPSKPVAPSTGETAGGEGPQDDEPPSRLSSYPPPNVDLLEESFAERRKLAVILGAAHELTAMRKDAYEELAITTRNEIASSVLEATLDGGASRVAILYGAGHMPDLESRLHRLGFELVHTEWLTVWHLDERADPARSR